MRTQETNLLNNGEMLLSKETLEQIKSFKKFAADYCENLSFLNDFLIRLIRYDQSEDKMRKFVRILTDITYLRSFIKSL
jgi:hypothetical protein